MLTFFISKNVVQKQNGVNISEVNEISDGIESICAPIVVLFKVFVYGKHNMVGNILQWSDVSIILVNLFFIFPKPKRIRSHGNAVKLYIVVFENLHPTGPNALQNHSQTYFESNLAKINPNQCNHCVICVIPSHTW